MSYSHNVWCFAYKENFIDQYLKTTRFSYKKQPCSNDVCKVIVNGNIKFDKLWNLFFNNNFLPPVKGIHIEKFKCDGNKFSFNIYSDNFELIDEVAIKTWWRDKQIDSILID